MYVLPEEACHEIDDRDHTTHDEFGKLSRGGFFTYAQGFRVNAACTAASPAINYTYIRWCVTYYLYMYLTLMKMPISNSNTWNIVLKFLKQWFSAQLLFIMNAVDQQGKRVRGSVVRGNSKSGKIPLIPWHLSCMMEIAEPFLLQTTSLFITKILIIILWW